MGLAQLQCLLAQLSTNADLRERFLADPRTAGLTSGLTEAEADELARLSGRQLRFFAASLRRKRLHAVARLLPRTREALGERFIALFEQHAELFVPRGTSKHQADALSFADFLEQRLRQEPVAPSRALDLLRYEAARLRVADPTTLCTVRWLRAPVEAPTRPPGTDDSAPIPAGRLTLAIWLRLRPCGRLFHLVVPLPRLP